MGQAKAAVKADATMNAVFSVVFDSALDASPTARTMITTSVKKIDSMENVASGLNFWMLRIRQSSRQMPYAAVTMINSRRHHAGHCPASQWESSVKACSHFEAFFLLSH